MLIIDRFENGWAVLEYDQIVFSVPRSLIPKHAVEGDVLDFSITVDHCTTLERKRKIKSLEDQLFKD